MSYPPSNGSPNFQPGRVQARLDTLEEDVHDAEEEIGAVRSDIQTIKYVLFGIAGMAASDTFGLLELLKTLA